MRAPRFRPLSTLALLIALGRAPAAEAQKARRVAPALDVRGASIDELHDRLRRGHASCHALVQAYLDRIAANDTAGLAIHAIVSRSTTALDQADSLDQSYAHDKKMGALHCVPVIVKDDIETEAMPTTAGSPVLAGYVAPRDATTVRRLRQAGAIVLAKSAMSELALTPDDRIAAAMAASFGAVALSSDVDSRVRGAPARETIVRIRPTAGLTSRAGLVPPTSRGEVTVPAARTLADAAAVLQVIAGSDAADSTTASADAKRAADYRSALRRDGLAGKRIGVLHDAFTLTTGDSAAARLFDGALAELRRQGAVIVDPVAVTGLGERLRGDTARCSTLRADVERWLTERGDRATAHTLSDLVASHPVSPAVHAQFVAAQGDTAPSGRVAACAQREERRVWLRGAVAAMMDSLRLDALVYPSVGAGEDNLLIAPSTGLPMIAMPMGNARGIGAVELRVMGRAWSEPGLIAIAYGYEQGTHRERPRSVNSKRRRRR